MDQRYRLSATELADRMERFEEVLRDVREIHSALGLAVKDLNTELVSLSSWLSLCLLDAMDEDDT